MDRNTKKKQIEPNIEKTSKNDKIELDWMDGNIKKLQLKPSMEGIFKSIEKQPKDDKIQLV